MATAPGHLRASHADRERVIGMLRTEFTAGLLTKAEFDLGVHRTLASRTYADLAAATAARRTQPHPKPLARPANAVACGACGLVVTAFVTIVIIPSGTTLGVVGITVGVSYAAFCLLAGILMLAGVTRRPWLRRSGTARRRWPRRPAVAPPEVRETGLAGTRRT
jgi:hypothetical protein